jgi:hydrogenase nickel incorporation protein HypA/HybF
MLDIAFDHARRHESEKILKVRVVVGKMSGVVVDSIRFCFEAITKDTVAEGAVLEIEEVRYTGKCVGCARSFEVMDYTLLCPDCGSTDIEITGGRELYVKDIEVE